jgi:hypothetical protein
MLERNLPFDSATSKHFIRLACEWGCPRLANEIAGRVEADSSAWVDILTSSVAEHYVCDQVDSLIPA